MHQWGREESSSDIKNRVGKARSIQAERFRSDKLIINAGMNRQQLMKFCTLKKESIEILNQAMRMYQFSGRAYDRILKISRTIADLAGSTQIESEHLTEAIQYRILDMNK